MCCICEKTKVWVNEMMERFRDFHLWDMAAFKLCLVSLGLLVGGYFHKTIKELRWLVWILFGTTYIYLMWRLFRDE